MRRSVAWALALALALAGGLAACGDDDGGGGGSSGTTAPTATTASADELAAAVDEFCAATEQFETAMGEMGAAGPISAEARAQREEETTALMTEAFQMKVGLDAAVEQMTPEDAARYEECGTFLGDIDVQQG